MRSITIMLYCYIATLLKRIKQFNNLTIQQFNNGFTLVELLVVIAIFALVASLVTASYISFEKRQRLADAAKTLVSDIRLTQNKALSGDKSTPNCLPGEKRRLVGWYLRINTNTASYSIHSQCEDEKTGIEDALGPPPPEGGNPPAGSTFKIVSLPDGIKISRFLCKGQENLGILILHILFRPLTNSISSHRGYETPPFFDNDGKPLRTRCPDDLDLGQLGQDVSIELLGEQGNLHIVEVKTSGAVHDYKK